MGKSIEQFIQDTNAVKTTDELFKLYYEMLYQYGYDSVCYCLATDHPSSNLKASHGVMQNYSEDWVKYYKEKNYKSIDPAVRHCFYTNRPFSWDWLVKSQDLANDEKQLMREADDAKLHRGLVVPIHGMNGELTAIGIASREKKGDLNEDILSKIRAVSYQFHIAYTEREALVQKYKNVQFSAKEKDILRWMAEGKSDSIVGEIMGVSRNTVRFHLKNIFKKLGVNDRVSAITIALRHGLILPSYVTRL